jgi:hypothetical protein
MLRASTFRTLLILQAAAYINAMASVIRLFGWSSDDWITCGQDLARAKSKEGLKF